MLLYRLTRSYFQVNDDVYAFVVHLCDYEATPHSLAWFFFQKSMQENLNLVCPKARYLFSDHTLQQKHDDNILTCYASVIICITTQESPYLLACTSI